MIIAFVGPQQDKWTPAGEESTRNIIRAYLATGKYAGVTSGECHLGGVDIWAREETTRRGIYFRGYPALKLQWDGKDGYRSRNILIAKMADLVVCITPLNYPDGRKGWCKHCRDHHVSSGGCWTARYAEKIGKRFDVVEVTV